MAYVTSGSLIKVSVWILCCCCASSAAQLEGLLSSEGVNGGIANLTLIPPKYNYQYNYGDLMHTVTCIADCRGCGYLWTRENAVAVWGGNSLKLGQLNLQDSGNYTCSVTLNGNDIIETVNISFVLSVKDTRRVTNFSLSINTDVLRVPLHSQVPEVTIYATCEPPNVDCIAYWMRPSYASLLGSVLNLGTMTYADAGQYFAVLHIGDQRDQQHQYNISLVITAADCESACIKDIRLDPPKTLYAAPFGHWRHTIECKADCYPLCLFQWVRGSNRDLVTYYAALELGHQSVEDFDTYYCLVTANDNKSSVIDQIEISVEYTGPTSIGIALSPNITTLATPLGQVAPVVTCVATCFPFNCAYTWKKDGLVVAKDADLVIGEMTYGDIGYYVCTARMYHTHSDVSINQSLVVTTNDPPFGGSTSITDPPFGGPTPASGGMTAGAIVGTVLGTVATLALIAGVILLYVRHRKDMTGYDAYNLDPIQKKSQFQ